MPMASNITIKTVMMDIGRVGGRSSTCNAIGDTVLQLAFVQEKLSLLMGPNNEKKKVSAGI